jgi:error-prone DNA polymerase
MTARFLVVRGRLQRSGLVVHVIAENFVDLSAELARLRDDDRAPQEMAGTSLTQPVLSTLKSRDFH